MDFIAQITFNGTTQYNIILAVLEALNYSAKDLAPMPVNTDTIIVAEGGRVYTTVTGKHTRATYGRKFTFSELESFVNHLKTSEPVKFNIKPENGVDIQVTLREHTVQMGGVTIPYSAIREIQHRHEEKFSKRVQYDFPDDVPF